MRIGSQLHSNATTWDRVLAVARRMDRGPWHSVWVPDHFVPPLPFMDEGGDCLEGWSLLTGLAAATEQLRLGAMVTGNTYRNPALLAKMAATVDHISNGRVTLGIGAAWHTREHTAYGWRYPNLGERCNRLEEATELIRALFRAEKPVDFQGTYYRLDRAPFGPKCVQDPHVPIMVGGNGERRTLRTLARFGDVMNLDECPPGDVPRKLAVLAEHCAEAGRDPAHIEKTALVPVGLQEDEAKAERLRELWGQRMRPEQRRRDLAIGSVAQIVDVLGRYGDAGIEHVMFKGVPNNPDLYHRLTEEVLPAVA